MARINAKPINATWAGDTPNKQEYDNNKIKAGIVFQSQVISKELNSALNTLSENMRYMQCAGGFYLENMRYFKGHIVALNVITNSKYGVGIRYFQCINDDNGKGIVNKFPYNTISARSDGNGLITYTVSGVNTTYWRECDAITKEIQDYTQNAIADKWKDLRNVSGTFNMNFGGTNNNFNNFTLTLTGATNFGIVSPVTGVKERSGLIVIKSGGANLKKFFDAGVAYYSFVVPIPIAPEGSGNNNMLIFPYKLIPQLNKVVFTRC